MIQLNSTDLLSNFLLRFLFTSRVLYGYVISKHFCLRYAKSPLYLLSMSVPLSLMSVECPALYVYVMSMPLSSLWYDQPLMSILCTLSYVWVKCPLCLSYVYVIMLLLCYVQIFKVQHPKLLFWKTQEYFNPYIILLK